MKEVLQFIKDIYNFFYDIKTKDREEGRVYTKCLLLYAVLIEDLIEIIEEEFSKNKLQIKLQAVAYHAITITE